MLALAEALRARPGPELDPEVRIVQRAQLVAAMEASLAAGTIGGPGVTVPAARRPIDDDAPPTHRRRRRGRWGRRLAAGGIAVGLAGAGFGGVAVASSDALPGDSLYGVKRTLEDFRLGLADSDEDRGKVYLDLASTRLDEARRLMDRDRPAGRGEWKPDDVTAVRKALAGMHTEASRGRELLTGAYHRGGEIGPMRRLADFTRSVNPRWTEVGPALPAELSPVRNTVDELIRGIDADIDPLRPALARQDEDGSGDGTVPQQPSGGPAQEDASGTERPSGTGAGDGGPDGTEADRRTVPDAKDSGTSGGPEPKEEEPGLIDGILKPGEARDGGSGEGAARPSAEGEATGKPSPSGSGEEKKKLLPPLLPGLQGLL
jgi:hypothetical protein